MMEAGCFSLNIGSRREAVPLGDAVPCTVPAALGTKVKNFRVFHERVREGLLLGGAALCLLPHAGAIS